MNSQITLTPEQADAMRQALEQYDAQNGSGAGKIVTFDLNNPPHKPYRYQEFPKALHHHEKRHVAVAKTAQEQVELEHRGYVEEPFAREESAPEEYLPPAEQREAESIDREARKAKAKK